MAALFELAHFVVLNRPGYPVANVLSPALAPVWQGRLAREPAALTDHDARQPLPAHRGAASCLGDGNPQQNRRWSR